jgi:hypothetical protein
MGLRDLYFIVRIDGDGRGASVWPGEAMVSRAGGYVIVDAPESLISNQRDLRELTEAIAFELAVRYEARLR